MLNRLAVPETRNITPERVIDHMQSILDTGMQMRLVDIYDGIEGKVPNSIDKPAQAAIANALLGLAIVGKQHSEYGFNMQDQAQLDQLGRALKFALDEEIKFDHEGEIAFQCGKDTIVLRASHLGDKERQKIEVAYRDESLYIADNFPSSAAAKRDVTDTIPGLHERQYGQDGSGRYRPGFIKAAVAGLALAESGLMPDQGRQENLRSVLEDAGVLSFTGRPTLLKLPGPPSLVQRN